MALPEREATPDEAFELGKVAGYDEGYADGRESARYDESRCQWCFRPNPPWSADNPLWNFATQGREGLHFLCPSCFIDLYESQNNADPLVWRLTTWTSIK